MCIKDAFSTVISLRRSNNITTKIPSGAVITPSIVTVVPMPVYEGKDGAISALDQIGFLKTLRDDRAITHEEYNEKKAQLLTRV